MWHSLVARLVRDEEAAGSNPVIPTRKYPPIQYRRFLFFILYEKNINKRQQPQKLLPFF